MTDIDMSTLHRRIVTDILAEHAPRPCRVWAFGSRVTGQARRFSDLDLAVDAGRALTLREGALLDDAFDESDLPWRVDVVDLGTCSERFRAEVERQAVPLVELVSSAESDRDAGHASAVVER